MKTSVLMLLVVTVAASGVLAACSAPDDSEPDVGDVGAGEDDLTALELKCRGGATTFDVSPAFGGVAIEGILKSGAMTSAFICNTPRATDAGADAHADSGDGGATSAGRLLATCTERPQSAHPGRWEVAITKSGTATKATIKRGSGTNEVIACVAPSRPDAGPGGAAVPTYAQVGPIINNTCGGCHSGSFDSLAKVKQRKTSMLGMITSGAMPRRNPTWKDSADGQKVLDFLRNSPQL